MTQGQFGVASIGAFFRDPRVRRVLYWCGVLAIWGLILLAALFLVFSRGLPDISRLDELKSEPSITYLDRSGSVVAVRGSQKTDLVKLDSLPAYVPKAFVVTEDQWFYWHPGFNPYRIVVSQIYNMQHRGKGLPLRGGSTITQQVARNLFGIGRQQTLKRKIQELILAVELEIRYSKKDILTLYMNRMDFGGGATGIEAASRRYFDKSATELSVGETALLVGTLKGTDRYSPVSNRERAQRRATAILGNMVKHKVITKEQRDTAFKTPVKVSDSPANQRAGYFIDWLDGQVRGAIGGDPTEDLVVQTTLDLPLQTIAESAMSQTLAANKKARVTQDALVSLDGEGRVRAYVGGPDFYDSPFDRVSNGRRQPGSSFKPFVYLAAMEAGKTPNVIEVDEPVTINGWSPSNYEAGVYAGPLPLQSALARSINTIAAKLTNEVGVGKVIDVAHRLGITTDIPAVPSIALGTAEVSPLEMAQAYAAFSNGGYKVKAYGVETIRAAKGGRILYDHSKSPPERQQVIGSPALQYMNQMMREVVRSGTGAGANVPGYDLAGKTGTTSDYHDAWFNGFTGGFTTVVWMAGPEGKNMAGVTGGGAPARAWKAYMSQALPRLQKQPIPGGIIEPPPYEANRGPLDAIGDLISQITGNNDAPRPAPTPAPPPQRAPAPAQELPY